MPVVTRTGASIALGIGSVRLEHIGAPEDSKAGVFVVKPPVVEGGEVGDGAGESDEEGARWLAKAFLSDWLMEEIMKDEAQKQPA